MKLVADHLRDFALNSAEFRERDLFGRSSFNRYYYAAYLIIREGFRRMGCIGENDELPHSNVPERLEGNIRRKFNSARLQAVRAEDQTLATRLSDAARAARELGNMMTKARATRTTADYFPEKPIELCARGFELMSVDIETAKSWPQKAEAFMSTIESAWRQIEA